jgi:hypothetical protein
MSKGGAREAKAEEAARQGRINEIFWRCRHKVLQGAGGLYSLPGEVIGAEIAEALMRAAYQQMLNNALASRARQEGDDPVRPGDIRAVSPLIVPGR